MKRKLLAGPLMVVVFGLSLTATASEQDCFPMCVEPATVAAKIEIAVDTKLDTVDVAAPREVGIDTTPRQSCDSGLIKKAEALNDKVRPIREIIGYVRSPQGLVIKLVNDHIVKIPAWIGYALDPIGSIKHKAIDELRTRARDAMADGNACDTAPANESFEAAGVNDAKLRSDARPPTTENFI